jgi:hypothetical protein
MAPRVTEVIVNSPFLTSVEAADYLRYKTVAGFHKAVIRYNIPCIRRGREKLFKQADLVKCWNSPLRPTPSRTKEPAA